MVVWVSLFFLFLVISFVLIGISLVNLLVKIRNNKFDTSSAIGIPKNAETMSESQVNSQAQAIISFLDAIATARVVPEVDEKWVDFHVEGSTVELTAFHVDRTCYLIFVADELRLRVFMEDGKFEEVTDEQNILSSESMSPFSAAFLKAHAHIEANGWITNPPNHSKVLAERLNSSSLPGNEQAKNDSSAFISRVEDKQIGDFIRCIEDKLQQLAPSIEALNIEQKHTVERIQNDTLPKLLQSFLVLEPKDQQEKREELLGTLSGIEREISSTLQSAQKQKIQAFEKRKMLATFTKEPF